MHRLILAQIGEPAGVATIDPMKNFPDRLTSDARLPPRQPRSFCVLVFARAFWFLVTIISALGFATAASARTAAELRTQYEALRARLTSSPFGQPMLIESTEASATLKGEVYAVLGQPFQPTGHALAGLDHWCDILILHLNVKICRTQVTEGDARVVVAIGRKYNQPLADAHTLEFSFRTIAQGDDHVAVMLEAVHGPLGTRDYQILVEAMPVDAQRTFVHMSYSYGYGVSARLAMKVYLATFGQDKVGFTIVERDGGGQPVYVDGVRGVVERNAMRYYLAIESYLGSLGAPAARQTDKRLRDWFAAIERYPRQLHEIDEIEYLSMKRREIERQNSMLRAGRGAQRF